MIRQSVGSGQDHKGQLMHNISMAAGMEGLSLGPGGAGRREGRG